MSLLTLLGIMFIAGALGGVINALLSDNGFILPKPEAVGATRIIRPGFLGNVFISGAAASIFWGLYGKYAANDIIASLDATVVGTSQAIELTPSELAGAVLVGVAGARWLTNEVDKRLLRAAASEAAASEPNPEVAKQLMTATPAKALKIAQKQP
jgi:hypothetical protein